MRFWKRKAEKGAEKSELDRDEKERLLIDALMRSPDSPRLRALLNEVRRGLERREEETGRLGDMDITQANEAGMRPMDANDLACLRMFAGASFAPGFSLRLPSGLTLTGNEINTARKWAEEE